jgi:hypothetical protein
MRIPILLGLVACSSFAAVQSVQISERSPVLDGAAMGAARSP